MTASVIVLLVASAAGAAATFVQAELPGLSLVERYGSFGLLAVIVLFGVFKVNATLLKHSEALSEVASALREGSAENRRAQETMLRELIGGMEERTQRIIRASEDKRGP